MFFTCVSTFLPGVYFNETTFLMVVFIEPDVYIVDKFLVHRSYPSCRIEIISRLSSQIFILRFLLHFSTLLSLLREKSLEGEKSFSIITMHSRLMFHSEIFPLSIGRDLPRVFLNEISVNINFGVTVFPHEPPRRKHVSPTYMFLFFFFLRGHVLLPARSKIKDQFSLGRRYINSYKGVERRVSSSSYVTFLDRQKNSAKRKGRMYSEFSGSRFPHDRKSYCVFGRGSRTLFILFLE